MGAQYPIMSGAGLTGPAWYRLGNFTATSGVRMLRIDINMQSPAGSFQPARLHFSTNNGSYVQNTYDATPVDFNAYAEMQVNSVNWFYALPDADVAVQQNSNTSYAFYVRITSTTREGFFTVYHSTGDTFTFVGTNAGNTRPSNGVHPMVSQPVDPAMIGAAPTVNPSFTGTLSTQNLGVSNLVLIPNDSLTIANTAGLIGALAGKATLGGPANFSTLSLSGLLSGTTVAGTTLIASSGFYSTTGFLTSTSSSQTIYQVGSSQRGLLVVDAEAPNSSSAVCFFSSASGVFWLSIVARNGNAFGTGNVGTAFSGTNNLNVFINSTGAIRVSTTSAGTTRWSIVLLPSS
jgi:hypothetical protein